MATLMIGVTGGTGHQAVRGLREQGANELIALTRDPSRSGAAVLRASGIPLRTGDLDEKASLDAALEGVDRIYLHGLSADSGTADPREADRGRRLARAAADAGIRHVVYNSADGCERATQVPHMVAVHQAEQAFAAAGVPFTALRATLFMEEYLKHHNRPDVLAGTLRLAHPPDFVQRFVSVRDLGRMAAMAFADPDRFADQVVEVATDALTPVELAAAFARAQGTPVVYDPLPRGFFESFPGTEELVALIEWYERDGYHADVDVTHATFPGCWRFADFLDAVGWADPDVSYASLSDGSLD